MNSLLRLCMHHTRTILMLFAFFVLSGLYAYLVMSKESYPDVKVPFAIVHLGLRGVAPGDAERLLVRPMERQLQQLAGLKEMISTSYEGGADIILEFQAGLDIDKLVNDARNEVDIAKADLPDDADEPYVQEVNLSHFPILVVQLSGNVPKRTLFQAAERLKDQIESVRAVLQSPIVGKQDQQVEILIDPLKLETYGFTFKDIFDLFTNNNKMIPAGNLDSGKGSHAIKSPGLIATENDIRYFPVRTNGTTTITLEDVADVRVTFKEPTGFARDRGVDAVALLVSKRVGQNIIETIKEVQNIVEKEKANWHGQIHVTYAQDGSDRVLDMLNDLQNNLILAVLLVIAVIVLSLGWRSSWLIGIAIPGSFLMGVFVLYLLGYTMNMVVLFSLILSVGMLVDGAIIVVEYADRKMLEGHTKQRAFLEGAQRMAWPVVTSITTILVVFFPLLYWPGVVGQFMKFLPITLLATLTASLLMALIFIPALGKLFGKVGKQSQKVIRSIIASETGSLNDITGLTGWYVRTLSRVLNFPGRILLLALCLLITVFMLYKWLGKGVEFFPDVEPDKASFLVHARGNMSIYEKDELVRKVEDRLLPIKAFKTIYTETVAQGQNDLPQNVIGLITVEFIDWREREKANIVLEKALKKVENIPGIFVEILKEQSGPKSGKPVSLQIIGDDYTAITETATHIEKYFKTDKDLMDIETSLPLNNIEWEIKVDRAEAAKYNVTIQDMGNVMQLATDGVKIDTYRPDTSRDEVDIRMRFTKPYRSLSQLETLKVPTANGNVPIRNFAKIKPQRKVETINRVNGHRYYKVAANVVPGVLIDTKVKEVQAWLKGQPIPASVDIHFKGEEDDKKETGAFLLKAFLVALFLILLILVTQFNSFFDAMLVLTAVVFSTFGVFVGLIVTQQPYGIVMSGLGVIALSGIIVSNNIIFLDTFKHLRHPNMTYQQAREAILRTGAQRLRPVLLTKITTILGLLPILFRLNIDFLKPEITVGSPSSEWWLQLSTAITFGVMFASVLTLILTPCALMVRENRRFRIK